jgi:glycosyltransferase involved in cell wall biosynthesis/SAM-dependent methyltransferase
MAITPPMKLAVFTPLKPVRSGIADYSQTLLPYLARHLEVTVFTDGSYEAEGFPDAPQISIRDYRQYRPDDFDETLYQFGNNPYHVYVYDTALKHPGINLLHEYNLHHLVAAATITRGDWDAYIREIEYDAGPAVLEYAARARRLEVGPDYDNVAMSRRVIEAGKATIVHSDFMVRQLREVGCTHPLKRIPHGAWIPEVNRNLYRTKLGVEPDTPLIGIFGFLKPYKRIRESLRAMQRVVRLDPRARMILVGEEHEEFPVQAMIERMGLTQHVRVLGYVPIEEFEQYIGAADICLNLRYPTVGETSGTLLRALGLGRAVIVSDVGAFADLPDGTCLKVPPDGSEVDLLTEYLNLLVNRPEVGRALGAQARNYVATECPWPKVAKQFADWIADKDRAGDEGSSRAREQAVPSNGSISSGKPLANARGSNDGVIDAAPDPQDDSPVDASDSNQLAEYIRSWCHNRDDDAIYVESHLTRLVRTLEITPAGSPQDRVLEMGAYMHITPALKSKLGYGEVRGSYLGQRGRTDVREVTSSSGDHFRCDVDLFNAERDPYPYDDGEFATVLCCELIEHLYDDPMHLMSEVNRIVRPGGHFVLSTPNVCSYRAVAAILLNYHPGFFHQYVKPDDDGVVDPRHAREFAPRDVQHLFEAAGFELVHLETGPYLERRTAEYEWVKHVMQRYDLPEQWRGDAIFAVGRKTGQVRERYPAALYVGGAA